MNAKLLEATRQPARSGGARLGVLLAVTWLSIGAAAESDVRRDATVEVVEKVMPAVVNIATARIVEYRDFYDELLREFYGVNRPPRRQEEPAVSGSGVLIDEEGYVLTNFHVVRGASRVQVKLFDGSLYEAEPRYLATAQKDVALLKLRLRPGEKRTFPAMKLARDDDLLLGETVLAMGNPYGLGGSVSRGILSSKNRRPSAGDEPLNVEDWLQTDAAINPGNSGGPLVNLRGELIGINVAVFRQGQGMGVGFAIPVKQIAAALSDFFAPELTDGLWFGARIGQSGSEPLFVRSVQNGSPAERAGLRVGQRIVQVNGVAPKNLAAFNRLLTGEGAPTGSAAADKGPTATLVVEQNGRRLTCRVELMPFAELVRQKIGLTLLELREAGAAWVGMGIEGLLIDDVLKDGPAARARLQRGLILRAVDGQPARSLLAVGEVLSNKRPGEMVTLTVLAPRRAGPGVVEYQVPVTVR
ncbi:MAG: trypsin-like peptidase domain-containing protein [Verrucomicrobiales bacterium]|nr:trypsin-like peptidase domain-containing protein [Verrucomicrobiales bacterium]